MFNPTQGYVYTQNFTQTQRNGQKDSSMDIGAQHIRELKQQRRLERAAQRVAASLPPRLPSPSPMPPPAAHVIDLFGLGNTNNDGFILCEAADMMPPSAAPAAPTAPAPPAPAAAPVIDLFGLGTTDVGFILCEAADMIPAPAAPAAPAPTAPTAPAPPPAAPAPAPVVDLFGTGDIGNEGFLFCDAAQLPPRPPSSYAPSSPSPSRSRSPSPAPLRQSQRTQCESIIMDYEDRTPQPHAYFAAAVAAATAAALPLPLTPKAPLKPTAGAARGLQALNDPVCIDILSEMANRRQVVTPPLPLPPPTIPTKFPAEKLPDLMEKAGFNVPNVENIDDTPFLPLPVLLPCTRSLSLLRSPLPLGSVRGLPTPTPPAAITAESISLWLGALGCAPETCTPAWAAAAWAAAGATAARRGLPRTLPLAARALLARVAWRWAQENLTGHTPVLREIALGDRAAGGLMVLVVTSVKDGAVTFSDGYYEMQGVLDQPLQALVDRGVIKTGTKLAIAGASLGGRPGSYPYDEKYTLTINYNSTRLAPTSPLGLQPLPVLPCTPLRHAHPAGGPLSHARILVLRVCPTLVSFRTPAGVTYATQAAAEAAAWTRSEARNAARGVAVEAEVRRLEQKLEDNKKIYMQDLQENPDDKDAQQELAEVCEQLEVLASGGCPDQWLGRIQKTVEAVVEAEHPEPEAKPVNGFTGVDIGEEEGLGGEIDDLTLSRLLNDGNNHAFITIYGPMPSLQTGDVVDVGRIVPSGRGRYSMFSGSVVSSRRVKLSAPLPPASGSVLGSVVVTVDKFPSVLVDGKPGRVRNPQFAAEGALAGVKAGVWEFSNVNVDEKGDEVDIWLTRFTEVKRMRD